MHPVNLQQLAQEQNDLDKRLLLCMSLVLYCNWKIWSQCDADAWCVLYRYKLMWAITSMNTDVDADGGVVGP